MRTPPMKTMTQLNRSLGFVLAGFLLCSSVFAYSPFLHEALHAHEEKSSSPDTENSKDLCSAQNHLAADLSRSAEPVFEVLQRAESPEKSNKTRIAYFKQAVVSSRAPPLASFHP